MNGGGRRKGWWNQQGWTSLHDKTLTKMQEFPSKLWPDKHVKFVILSRLDSRRVNNSHCEDCRSVSAQLA